MHTISDVTVGLPTVPNSLSSRTSTFSLPEWWSIGQQRAGELFSQLPFPSGKDEKWRFASTSKIRLEGYQAGVIPTPESVELARAAFAARKGSMGLCFVNDVLVAAKAAPELLQKGVIFCSLAEALHLHGELLQKTFMTQAATLGGEKFAALHRLHVRNGLFLFVPKNIELPEPVEVFYWQSGEESALFPHNLVITESHAKADLRVYYQNSQLEKEGFSCAVSDFYVGAGAQLRNVHVQNLGDKALSLHISSTTVERDALATSLHVNLGGHYARLENKSRLVGNGARSEMFSLTPSHGDQEFDQRTFQEHVFPHTVSDLLYKNALSDDSRTIFAGMIDVDPNAQQTNAYQSNRNLLLSTTAEASSLPGLEIMANDVRCTHGSTTGQINDEELFYLLQRGIPLKVARKLFVLGFFDEVIARLKDEKLGEELHAIIENKFISRGLL